MMWITNFFGGLWLKLLILGGIVLGVLTVILRMQSNAEKAGRLEEQAQQRIRNEKIRKLQEQDRLNHRVNTHDIDALLNEL